METKVYSIWNLTKNRWTVNAPSGQWRPDLANNPVLMSLEEAQRWLREGNFRTDYHFEVREVPSTAERMATLEDQQRRHEHAMKWL